MNILVTGANGQLGNEIRLLSAASAHRFVFTDVVMQEGVGTTYLDITDIEAVRRMVASENIDAIVNCAAYNNVEKAEDDIATCELLNVQAPCNLARVMKETGGFTVHISSDYVFGGASHNEPCREDQPATPANVYGRTKLEGEQAVRNEGGDHVIIRTSWLYSEFGKNFLKTMLALTSSRPELNVVFDQTGTPTYARDLADAISVVLDDYSAEKTAHPAQSYSRTGLYHYSNEGVCSWYDFAQAIAELSGHSACTIRPCHSDEFPSKVRRPSYSVLDKTRIKETFGLTIPYWTDSLKKCISALQNKAGEL